MATVHRGTAPHYDQQDIVWKETLYAPHAWQTARIIIKKLCYTFDSVQILNLAQMSIDYLK